MLRSTLLIFFGFAICIVALVFSTSAVGPATAIARGDASSSSAVCLLYHRFVTSGQYAALTGRERIYSIPVDRFEGQLRALREAGYRSIGADEAVALARGEKTFGSPAVLVTIDDGCRSAKSLAEPVLRRLGFRAALFVTTDPRSTVFDRTRSDQAPLSREELASLDPAVWEVQSHGVTHRPLRDLPPAELERELRDSRDALQRITGRPVRYLAIPGNWYDARVLRAAQDAGYAAVFVSERGVIRPGTDVYRLPRINVAGYFSLDTIHALIDARRYPVARR